MSGFTLPECIRCPHCGSPLIHEGKSLYCTGERRHTYDIAKEGYVNLLPPGRAKNARTGDSPEMIRARQQFLDTGGYDRYSREAMELASPHLTPSDRITLVDAGCGEGRHTVNMASALQGLLNVPVTAIGFDASKHGSAAAAKRYVKQGLTVQTSAGSSPPQHPPVGFSKPTGSPSCDGLKHQLHSAEACPPGLPGRFFSAANIFAMPMADGTADVLTSLFAPLPHEEAYRILKPGGILVICAAGERHLYEMRDILYSEVIPSGGGATVPEGFTAAGETLIEYPLHLNTAGEIMSLFTMTPFCHNAPAEGKARLEAADSLDITVQVKCTVAIKNK